MKKKKPYEILDLEKCDIFALGLVYLQLALLADQKKIKYINENEKRRKKHI